MNKENKEIIAKKAENIHSLIEELRIWTNVPFAEFDSTITLVRASERNLEMLVELSSDINAIVALEKTNKTPDSYKDSFQMFKRLGLIDEQTCKMLMESVELRNIIVHEYDFEVDNKKMFDSLQNDFLPAYTIYVKAVVDFLRSQD